MNLIGFEKEKSNNILGVEVKNYKDCDWCKDKNEEIQVPFEMMSAWLFLLYKFGDSEWAAVLKIKDEKIVDWEIPEQEKSSVTVEFCDGKGYNGLLHSHHRMGSFHSSQDDTQGRNLYDYSFVISTSGLIGSKRTKLPCGGFGYKDLNLVLVGIPENLKLDRIKEKKFDSYHSWWQDTDKKGVPEVGEDELYPCDCCGIEFPISQLIETSEFHTFGDGFLICKTCYQNEIDATEVET